MLTTFLRLRCECLPLEKGQKGGSNLLRWHALHSLYAAVNEGLHSTTVVDFRLSVKRFITVRMISQDLLRNNIITSIFPRVSHCPVFDCLQYA